MPNPAFARMHGILNGEISCQYRKKDSLDFRSAKIIFYAVEYEKSFTVISKEAYCPLKDWMLAT
jgi:hypothetical protein